MQDTPLPDAAQSSTREEWLERLAEIGDEAGYFEPLGARHHAFFVDDSPTLLVCFDTVEQARAGTDQMPFGHALARKNGWSYLGILAEDESWYRDPAVYGYFDRLTDDAFFEDFDRVTFYGAGMGGYGAAAYSVAAPGATVVALAPVATLDPAVAGWDGRYRHARRLNFTDRFGYAPDMIEGAGEVFVLFDPFEPLDAMHAALFTRPFVTKLACRHFGDRIEPMLHGLGLVEAILERACTGRLDAAGFWSLLRARRGHAPYLRRLLAAIDAQDRPYLAAILCRAVLDARGAAPRFRRRLDELRGELEARGVSLPEPTLAPA